MSEKQNERIIKKKKKEQAVVSQMIHLYCSKNHNTYDKKARSLCAECKELLDYSIFRSEHCPYMAEKTFCSNCKTHCYKSDMRQRIKTVMRFSGPRMILYHPFLAIWHLICSKL